MSFHNYLKRMAVVLFISFALLTTQVTAQANKSICPKERVRLVGGSTEYQGLVEVCSDGRWGTVQTSQPQQVAKEVCRMLNFNEMNETTSVSVSNVSLTSSEPGCVYNCSIICGSLTCEESKNNFDVLSISCLFDLESCDNGQVRLTDGYSYREGRVEVCLGGLWGSVYNCDREGIAGSACYQSGFPRKGAMATSYGEDTERGYCCRNTTIALQNCEVCLDLRCNILGVVCQNWDQLQPTNNASECTVQPPMIEPTSSATTASSVTDFTSLDSTTSLSRGTEHVASDNNTVTLLGAIIGVLFALLLATLVGWMCTCIIMHRNNTTKSTSSATNNPLITDDNYSLGQVIECVYDEATPTQPPPTDPAKEGKPKTHTAQMETDYADPNQLLFQTAKTSTSNTVTTSDDGIGEYAVIDHNKPKPSNPPPVKVEASKSDDEFYNAEVHMYAAAVKGPNNREGENKTKKGAKQPVYDVAMPGEAVWGVEGAAV